MHGIDVRAFIQANYVPYTGDASFLSGPTARTKELWDKLSGMFVEERRRGGVYDVDTHTPAGITAHAPGYIDRESELIVGLQTDAPLKRAIMPAGGLRLVEAGLDAYGYQLDPQVKEIFTKYRKTHNDGVFDAYTAEILRARKAGIITGLPDAYGRGRIIGDYRRVPLYGVDRLIEAKRAERVELDGIWPQATSSGTARNSPNRSAPWKNYGRWPPPTATTSPAPPRTRARPSSGCTSLIWLP